MKIHAEALLFDNDGTLISSMASVYRCRTRWAEEFDITAQEFGRVEPHGRTGLRSGRAAGMRAVALTATHQRSELVADAVVGDLSAISVQVGAAEVKIDTVG